LRAGRPESASLAIMLPANAVANLVIPRATIHIGRKGFKRRNGAEVYLYGRLRSIGRRAQIGGNDEMLIRWRDIEAWPIVRRHIAVIVDPERLDHSPPFFPSQGESPAHLTRVRTQSRPEYDDSGEPYEAEERCLGLVVAGGDPARALKAVHRACVRSQPFDECRGSKCRTCAAAKVVTLDVNYRLTFAM
jgi:hypothetical protein